MDRVIAARTPIDIEPLRNAPEPENEEPTMKTINPITLAAIATLTAGQAIAQGNPHLDTVAETTEVVRYQGNPHLDAPATPTRYVAHYRGNPHEGFEFKVIRVARTQANPHAGFEIAPLTIASSQ